MHRSTIFRLGKQSVRFYPNGKLIHLAKLLPGRRLILITDQNLYKHHKPKFSEHDTIVLRAGEQYKVQATIDGLINQLINMQADRTTVLVGVGGGVVTDLVGYLASIYLRGVDVGFVPTTLLSMVDASIGGKNGVDVGMYKNLVGTIRQPQFILHDYELLSSLPAREWSNGFAEIIKHAVIGDPAMFKQLNKRHLNWYRQNPSHLQRLVVRNVQLKFRVVQQDVSEQGVRKTLNFGHTLGHALEMHYELSHGEAISLGMMFAAQLSEKLLSFPDRSQIASIVQRYELPTDANFAVNKVFHSLQMDKKRVRTAIDFVLLKKIGEACIQSISLQSLKRNLEQYI